MYRSILIDRFEAVLHPMFGDQDYWLVSEVAASSTSSVLVFVIVVVFDGS